MMPIIMTANVRMISMIAEGEVFIIIDQNRINAKIIPIVFAIACSGLRNAHMKEPTRPIIESAMEYSEIIFMVK